MSDYARANTGGATHFTDKDGLTSGDSDKLIVGSEHDSEFNAILTATNSKHDSGDIASEAEAQAGTDSSAVMTPLRTQTWGDANGGLVGEIRLLADPAADGLLGWDDSASASSNVVFFTAGTGMVFTGTTFKVDLNDLATETSIATGDFIAMVDITDSGSGKITLANLNGDLVHDNLSGFVANEHIDHSGVSVIAGTGLTGGGTIAASRTLNVIGGAGIDANANDIAIEISGLSAITGAGMVSTDGFLVDNGGVPNRLAYTDAGIAVATVTGTSDTLATADMNKFIEYTNGSAVTVTLNTGVGKVGNIILIKQTGAGTVTIAGTATIESAVGVATNQVDSVIALVNIASGVWSLFGDQA